METIVEDSIKSGLVMKKKGKQNSTTGISASLTPDYREKEERTNNIQMAWGRGRH